MTEQDKLYWGFLRQQDNPGKDLGLNPNFVEMPREEVFLASCANILRNVYGYVESVRLGNAVDRNGAELPLYTYAAIEYLDQFDYSAKRVFEFGAGASTLYWMRRAREVVSVDNSREWCDKLAPRLAGNARVLFAEGAGLPAAIRQFEAPFDVIIIDSGGYRYDCAREAVGKLADGGLVVLDNADWHPATAALLKQSVLLQVDMTGFKPCYSHTSSTSLFFHRAFDFPTVAGRQPVFGLGAKRLHSADWDRPSDTKPSVR